MEYKAECVLESALFHTCSVSAERPTRRRYETSDTPGASVSISITGSVLLFHFHSISDATASHTECCHYSILVHSLLLLLLCVCVCVSASCSSYLANPGTTIPPPYPSVLHTSLRRGDKSWRTHHTGRAPAAITPHGSPLYLHPRDFFFMLCLHGRRQTLCSFEITASVANLTSH